MTKNAKKTKVIMKVSDVSEETMNSWMNVWFEWR